MKRIFTCVLLVGLLMSMAGFTSSAYTQSYSTRSFDVDVEVTENHVFHVTETIEVDFHQPKHGIFRYIPYQLGIYKIKNIQVEGDDYEVSDEGQPGKLQKIIKVGDADKTLKGIHTYKIRYDIVGYEDKLSDADYFSLDVFPTEWETPIQSATAKITFPKAFQKEWFQIFSGSYGYQYNDGRINPDYDESNQVITIDAGGLSHHEGVTLNGKLPQGYWVDAANRDFMIYVILGLLLAAPLLMAILWLFFGRDPKVIKTVELRSPQGLTPAEIGYIVDGVIDTKDLASMIMYYGEKGWLSIEEYEKGAFRLHKIKDIDTSEKTFSKTLFNALFEQGDRVDMEKLPEDFGEYFLIAKSQLKGQYRRKEKALFTNSSRICRGIGLCIMFLPPILTVVLSALMTFEFIYLLALLPIVPLLAVGLLMMVVTFDKKDAYSKKKRRAMFVVAGIFILAGTLLAAMAAALATDRLLLGVLTIVSTFMTLFFVILMKKRTKAGAKLLGRVLGFREFIETAELERLKVLAEEDPSYFYNVMPYAYVMGLSDKWAKNFEKIPTSAPVWYGGYGGNAVNPVFSVLWYSSMVRRCTDSFSGSVIHAVAAQSADVGGGTFGGFSGGGFSGGGFGGGGGGAW